MAILIKLRAFALLLLLFIGETVLAQDTYKYALFADQLQFINPAFSGKETTALLSTRNQWVSVENAPKTTSFSAGTPIKNNLGIGVNILNNSLFVENKTIASADVSYKLTLGDDNELFLGLRGGGYFYKVDPLNLITSGSISDPSQQTQAYFAPIIGAGAYWKYKNIWVSYSIPQLVKIGALDPAINSAINVQHYAAAGGVLPLSENFSLNAAMIYRKVEGLNPTQQFATAIVYQEFIEFGVSYYSTGNAALTGQLKLSNLFHLGYAYERAITNTIGGLDRRTHEVFIKVQLDSLFGEKGETETEEVPEEEGN